MPYVKSFGDQENIKSRTRVVTDSLSNSGLICNNLTWFNYSETEIDDDLRLQVLERTKRKHWKQFQKETFAAICRAILYHTRRARNWKKFKGKHVHTEEAVAQIKKEIIERVQFFSSSRKAQKCKQFIQLLSIQTLQPSTTSSNSILESHSLPETMPCKEDKILSDLLNGHNLTVSPSCSALLKHKNLNHLQPSATSWTPPYPFPQ
ncbi:hypothetical protein H5410_033178 [Solanum commersonii]|uniref:Uncharacterized protein n=1 Tax=Solanum commersonii TaxID=4109 RepID=A0A9J5YQ08_SOLCO|nr:hypothetical protein H5410_033178 [Solanum commersonii]